MSLAQLLMQEAENLNQSLENKWGSAGSHYYWGYMLLVNGRWGEALNAFNKAIEFSDKAQAEAMAATTILGKANYYALIGATDSRDCPLPPSDAVFRTITYLFFRVIPGGC